MVAPATLPVASLSMMVTSGWIVGGVYVAGQLRRLQP